MSKHPLFCFMDADPSDLPLAVTKRLARGRVHSLFVLSRRQKEEDPMMPSQAGSEFLGEEGWWLDGSPIQCCRRL